MKICSDLNDERIVLSCDLPDGHKGLHQATILWGDEGEDEE